MKKKFVSALMGLLLTATAVTAIPAVTAEAAAWQKNSVGWWWQKDDGSYPANSWQFINGKWYAFDQNGYMRHGWFLDGSTWYYLGGADDGSMKTGWQLVNGTWYYMNGSGAMLTGWQFINGNWYYMNGSGAMLTGWQFINGNWYYMYADGRMAANTWVGNYYVNGSGAWTQTKEPAKWIQSGSRWWYRHEDGGYTTNGFETIGGKKYYFDGAGWMVTGWQKINNTWYYFDASGAMASNQWIGNYYVGADGKMAVNTWIGSYYVGADGAWIPGYQEQHTHNYKATVTKEATCTADGVKTYTCAGCGDSYTEKIPATGHKYASKVTKQPTCGAEGVKTFTCSVCGASYEEAIQATGKHTYDAGVVTTEPTCGTEGEKTYTCTVCGDHYTESIPVVDHRWVHHDAVTHEEIITPAWDEKVAIWKIQCNGCGEWFDSAEDAISHIMMDFGDECQNYSSKIYGYDIIHHDAVTETVVDVPAYDECSVCGTTK